MNNEEAQPDSGLENALKSTAKTMEDMASTATHQLEENFQKTRAKLLEMQQNLLDLSKNAARDADFYVHENPWTSVGIAASVGLVIGFLLNRR